MFDKVKEENILFLDIETVSATYKFENLNERFKNLWAKKMSFFMERDGKLAEELYTKAAIWAEFGKIVCISVGYLINKNGKKILRIKSFSDALEKDLLENFGALLNEHFYKDKHFLCAHNGKEFDFPYIARRMLVNGVQLPKLLNIAGKKPWEVKHIDTMELWKFGDHKHYTSLDLLTELFNVDSPKSEMDGSMVSKAYWEDKKLHKIVAYCQNDVVALCKVFLKFCGKVDLTDLEIEIVEPTS
ncbi:MAG: 3'-5' exonuclease [Salinivirgaceae bacterium]|nr:3'-5' exonuclease [Salinivirgaceae bacterium]